MREFSLVGFIEHLARLEVEAHIMTAHVLEHAAKVVEKEAKHEIGTYQGPAGPFGAWESLSEATLHGFHHPLAGWIHGKEELGYSPPDNPLLRKGTMRDSISHEVEMAGTDAGVAHVGSPDPIAEYQEFGTPHARYPIPGRHFLGGALFRKEEELHKICGEAVVTMLVGDNWMSHLLGD